MEALITMIDLARRFWQRFGAYLIIELVLPGGSLIALALLLYRSGKLPQTALVPIARLRFAGLRR